MKKFQFTLASLKKYREQILDSEKNTLSVLRAELAEMNEALEQKLIQIEGEQEKLRKLAFEGTTANRLAQQKRFITSLQQDIYRMKAGIKEKETEVEGQLEKVVDATKEVSKLEKLEEKQIEEYKYMEQKESEQFIEEFVSNSSFTPGS